MRILFVSNAGWVPSGYGTQVASLVPRLRDLGHELAVFAFYGLQGGSIEWNGIKHYGAAFQPYGNDVIHLHASDFKADIVTTLIDVWVLRPDIHELVRWVPWSPIDHEPVPPSVLERLRNAWAVLVYSKHAFRELERCGLRPLYAPHGFEGHVFQPSNDKRSLRRKFGIPQDAFVVGMVAANQSNFPTRKGFERIFTAFARLPRSCQAVLYVHTYPIPGMGGVDLVSLVRLLGIENRVYFTRPEVFQRGGLSREQLAELYNCFDLLACPSMAEGFGIPLVESAACGVPSIATRFTAMTELCFSGWYIEPVTYVITPLLSFQAVPSVDSIIQRITYAYDHPEELREKGRLSLAAAQEYEWDNVVNSYWAPALRALEERLRLPPHAESQELDFLLPRVDPCPVQEAPNGYAGVPDC